MNSQILSEDQVYSCGKCRMTYYYYHHLLEHLFWKHGTESQVCNKCCLKKWRYALHICDVLPIAECDDDDTPAPAVLVKTEYPYCLCREESNDEMIGCDGPGCVTEWFHFGCVGVVKPPDGEWYCPRCVFTPSVQEKIAAQYAKSLAKAKAASPC